MVEETLYTFMSEMQMCVVAEDAKVDCLQSSLMELQGTVKDTEGAYAAWSASYCQASTSLIDATAAVEAASRALAEKLSAQASGESNLASSQEDKLSLENAYHHHFEIPMKDGDGPHYTELEPFLEALDIEQSMRASLPRVCRKAKQDRSDSEEFILERLEMAIAVRISTLTDSLACASTAAAEATAAVQVFETELKVTKAAQDIKAAEFEAIEKAREEGGEEALIRAFKAKQILEEIGPQIQVAIGLRDHAKVKLADFESDRGPLASFIKYKAMTRAMLASESM